MRNNYNFLSFLFVSLLIIGCSSKTDTFKQEAQAFCELHAPENWRDYKNTGLYSDFQDELVKRISKVVVSEEFRNIFKELSESPYSPDLNVYDFYKVRISKLIEQEWDCPNAKVFYPVEWRREPSTPGQANLDGVDNDNAKLVIRLEQNGDYIINSETVAARNTEKIDRLLRELTNKKPKVMVITADGVSKEQLLEAMQKLGQLGVVNLSIVTQGTNPPKLD